MIVQFETLLAPWGQQMITGIQNSPNIEKNNEWLRMIVRKLLKQEHANEEGNADQQDPTGCREVYFCVLSVS